ncbi:P-loop NTPase [Brevibacterium casei]|uniref:P-loop NTPase n=1 Tax=Brevibacterium casei TaxID=33889 RepID=UPI0002FE4DED|nr:SIR2 family protein [Brevibacterium casei]
MLDLQKTLGDASYDEMMRGIALGQYNLLLGAGASADSTDKDGNSMPVGFKLRDEIASIHNLSDTSDKSLKRVYGLVESLSAADRTPIVRFFKDRFTQTQPADWLQTLLRIQWDTAWTLNVDDTIEAAHQKLGSAARQQLKSISWTDKHFQADKRKDELLLIHLHGKAHRSNRANELIFDIASYTSALTMQHRWLKIFGDDFPSKPFIIIGASMDEEIDLQDIFREGRIKNISQPSIIVLRHIDEFQKAEYLSYGLIPIEATGEQFIDAVYHELNRYLESLTDEEVISTDSIQSESIRFLDQWKRLELSNEIHNSKGHDLYLGHEPTWRDSVNDYISRRPVAKLVIDKIENAHSAKQSCAVLLQGDAFSGKSCVLLRIAKELREATYRPWLFIGDQALDIEAVIHKLKREPKLVLLIDDASDFADDVQELLEYATELKLRVNVILVDRKRRSQHISKALITADLHEITVHGTLRSQEIQNLVNTLKQKRRLGVLTNMSRDERNAYFDKHGQKLFSAMAALEDGRGFRQRVADELAVVSSMDQKRLLAAVSLTSRLGYPLPFELIKTAANLTPPQAQLLVENELSDLVEIRTKGIATRHRIFGELLIEELSLDERKAAVVKLGLAVAPYVSPQAIHEATLFYRIARGLMGVEILSELVGAVEVLSVYEELEEAYDWNARFWDQRALAAASAHLYEQAFSWAQQAVARKRDALSLTTIGKVLMLRALNEASGGEWPTDSFEKAEEYLQEARTIEGSRAEYPIETFLSYMLRVMEKVPARDDALNEQLKYLWGFWFSSILELEEASQKRLERVREQSIKAWQSLWPNPQSN